MFLVAGRLPTFAISALQVATRPAVVPCHG
jgi:hypothetical protein